MKLHKRKDPADHILNQISTLAKEMEKVVSEDHPPELAFEKIDALRRALDYLLFAGEIIVDSKKKKK